MEYTDTITTPQLDTLMDLLNKHNEEIHALIDKDGHSKNLMDNPDMIG